MGNFHQPNNFMVATESRNQLEDPVFPKNDAFIHTFGAMQNSQAFKQEKDNAISRMGGAANDTKKL